jgi:hypothetical protein
LQDAQIKKYTADAEKDAAETEAKKLETAYFANPETQRKIASGDIQGVIAGMPKMNAGNLVQLAQFLNKKELPTPIGAGGLRMPDGQVIPPAARPTSNTPETKSPLARLIAERDALPPDSPIRKTYETAITHATNPQSQRIIIPREPRQQRDPMAEARYKAGLKSVEKDDKDIAGADNLERDLTRFEELNSRVSTGRLVSYRPAIMQPEYQEMLGLEKSLSMNNFKPNQGAISNAERQLIKGGGPNTMNDEETNKRMIKLVRGGLQNLRDKAAFKEIYLEAKGDVLGADKMWNEYIEKNPRYISQNGDIVENTNRKNWETVLVPRIPQGISTQPTNIQLPKTPQPGGAFGVPPPGAVRIKNNG